jgi:hypothetical protein
MRYTSLDPNFSQIRLLHIQPAALLEDDVECRMSTVSLDDLTVEYEALSYVWGDRDKDQTIQLEGAPWTVTANLCQALRNIRLADRARVMWVDAICIDQSDLDERGSQVAFMGAIYRQALMVIIWLGEVWPDLDLAWRFFTVSEQTLRFTSIPSGTLRMRKVALTWGPLDLFKP